MDGFSAKDCREVFIFQLDFGHLKIPSTVTLRVVPLLHLCFGGSIELSS